MPDLKHGLQDPYYLDRVYFEGTNVGNASDWQWAINKFDAALGGMTQGDLYVVVVDANKVSRSDREAYLEAVSAYWESPRFGKDALSKNAVILVLGTKDGKTVDWANGMTGMPSGNEAMLQDFSTQIPGTALTPAAVFGDLNIEFPPTKDAKTGQYNLELKPETNPGILEKIMLTGPDRFERAQMSSYLYLKGELKPTTGQTIWILVVYFVLALIGWTVLALFIAPWIAENFTRKDDDDVWRQKRLFANGNPFGPMLASVKDGWATFKEAMPSIEEMQSLIAGTWSSIKDRLPRFK